MDAVGSLFPHPVQHMQSMQAPPSAVTRYHSILKTENSRLLGQADKAKRALSALEKTSLTEKNQLLRTGGRKHLGLWRHHTSLRRALLELEHEQWRQAATILQKQELIVLSWLREVDARKEKVKKGPRGTGEQEREEPKSSAIMRPPAELLEADSGVKILKRRRFCLARLCDQAEKAMGKVIGETGWAGAEGGEERRLRLLGLIEEAQALYLDDGDAVDVVHPVRDVTGPESSGISSSTGAYTSRPLLVPPDSSSSPLPCRPSPATSVPPSTQSSVNVPLLPSCSQPGPRQAHGVMGRRRQRVEAAFAFLLEDQRYREGRLLDRWLTLLEESASQSNVSAASRTRGEGQGGLPGAVSALGRSLPTTTTAVSNGSGSPRDTYLYTPRCIVAFINYFVHDRLLVPYALPPALRPALLGLMQALVFRRARRASSGYVKGGDQVFPELNKQWREQVQAARRLDATALGVPPPYLWGCPFPETARVLSEMALSMTPLEMTEALLRAVRCLHHEAGAAAVKAQREGRLQKLQRAGGEGGGEGDREARTAESEPAHSLPADVLFPLLVYALVQSECPDIFSCLYVLRHFASGNHVGEQAYYCTTLEAAVAHIFWLPVGEERRREGGSHVAAEDETGGREGGLQEAVEEEGGMEEPVLEDLGPSFSVEEQERGLQFLDEWLAAEAAMEETMDILEQDGWF